MSNILAKRLRKVLTIGIVLVMSLGILCACNNDDDFRNPKNGEPQSGEFYKLQEAFDNGWISKGDLRNMAYYHNGDAQRKGFKPTPIEPLSAETELAIKEEYIKKYNEPVEMFRIQAYYGVYEGMYALMFGGEYATVITEETIGGIKFVFSELKTIFLWKE